MCRRSRYNRGSAASLRACTDVGRCKRIVADPRCANRVVAVARRRANYRWDRRADRMQEPRRMTTGARGKESPQSHGKQRPCWLHPRPATRVGLCSRRRNQRASSRSPQWFRPHRTPATRRVFRDDPHVCNCGTQHVVQRLGTPQRPSGRCAGKKPARLHLLNIQSILVPQAWEPLCSEPSREWACIANSESAHSSRASPRMHSNELQEQT
jgi:hypothetical protein